MNKQSDQIEDGEAISAIAGFIQASGAILAISYPVLALSAGVRAAYQIVEAEPGNSPWVTLLGSLLYTIATVGFARQPRPAGPGGKSSAKPGNRVTRWWQAIAPAQAWRISMGVLVVETLMILVVGTLSYTHPDLLGRNVWQFFGRDYGYFPLIQPLLGLAWLLHPQTRQMYGLTAE